METGLTAAKTKIMRISTPSLFLDLALNHSIQTEAKSRGCMGVLSPCAAIFKKSRGTMSCSFNCTLANESCVLDVSNSLVL